MGFSSRGMGWGKMLKGVKNVNLSSTSKAYKGTKR